MFLGQSFEFTDLPRICFISFLEILLSADNAIVIGVIAARLPPDLRKKALLIGTVSACIFRAISIGWIGYIFRFRWIQLLGAIYLLWLSIFYFSKKPKKEFLPNSSTNFWKTVLWIELFDLLFALDSILAAMAFITDQGRSKIWMVYVGGMLGLFAIRFVSFSFTQMIHQYPRLEKSAYLMIGWIGLKMGFQVLPVSFHVEIVFWIGMVLIFGWGLMKKNLSKPLP